jgi:hypothetical protein
MNPMEGFSLLYSGIHIWYGNIIFFIRIYGMKIKLLCELHFHGVCGEMFRICGVWIPWIDLSAAVAEQKN